MQTYTRNLQQQGVLTATPQTLPVVGFQFPMTVTFKSTNGSRAVAISGDGGDTFVPATTYASATAALMVHLQAPVTHIQFTGAVGDKFSIL